MNLVNLCLRIPNLGILLFYLIFIVIIPYLLILNNSLNVLKFYLPMLIAFANLLTQVGDEKLFKNLYMIKPDNFVAFLSSNFINLFALFGILWQCLEYSKSSGNTTKAVIYGALLFIIAFPFARNGLVFVLENVDYYLREKTELTYEYNWHLLVFGLLYIIFLLGFQSIILALVDSDSSKVASGIKREQPQKSEQKKLPKVKSSKKDLQRPKSKDKQEAKSKPKVKVSDGKTNNNSKNRDLLKNSTLSNLNNLKKYLDGSLNDSGSKKASGINKASGSNKASGINKTSSENKNLDIQVPSSGSNSSSSSSFSKKKKITRRLIPIN